MTTIGSGHRRLAAALALLGAPAFAQGAQAGADADNAARRGPGRDHPRRQADRAAAQPQRQAQLVERRHSAGRGRPGDRKAGPQDPGPERPAAAGNFRRSARAAGEIAPAANSFFQKVRIYDMILFLLIGMRHAGLGGNSSTPTQKVWGNLSDASSSLQVYDFTQTGQENHWKCLAKRAANLENLAVDQEKWNRAAPTLRRARRAPRGRPPARSAAPRRLR